MKAIMGPDIVCGDGYNSETRLVLTEYSDHLRLSGGRVGKVLRIRETKLLGKEGKELMSVCG